MADGQVGLKVGRVSTHVGQVSANGQDLLSAIPNIEHMEPEQRDYICVG